MVPKRHIICTIIACLLQNEHRCITWLHPRNWKYITYCNAIKQGPRHGHKQNYYKIQWNLAVWFSSYVSRQMNKETFIWILHTLLGATWQSWQTMLMLTENVNNKSLNIHHWKLTSNYYMLLINNNSMQVFRTRSKHCQSINSYQSKYLLGIEATNGFVSFILVLENNESKAGSTVRFPNFNKTPIYLERLA